MPRFRLLDNNFKVVLKVIAHSDKVVLLIDLPEAWDEGMEIEMTPEEWKEIVDSTNQPLDVLS